MAGRHCGSTALSNLVRMYGWPLSEADCFGLGAGLEALFVAPTADHPVGLFFGRGEYLEHDFFKHLRIPATRNTSDDSDRVLQYIQASLKADRPVLVQADVRYIDYYHSPESFAGHKLLIVGYDDGNPHTLICSDTAFPGLQTLTWSSLNRAMQSESSLFPGRNVFYDLELPLAAWNEERGLVAVQSACHRMLELLDQHTIRRDDRGRVLYWQGSAAYGAWQEHSDFMALRNHPGFLQSCRFMYQVIEKRGTGRGAFRGILADWFAVMAKNESNASHYAPATCRALETELRKQHQILANIARVYKMLSLEKKEPESARAELRGELTRAQQSHATLIELLREWEAQLSNA